MDIRIGVILAVVTMMAGGSRSSAGPPDPISGDWNVSFELQGMTTPATFRFALAGDRVSGTAQSHHTGPGKIREGSGSWRDGLLSFTLDFESHESIELTGRLKDGELSGEFRTEGMRGQWKARKGSPSDADAAVSAGHRPVSPYAPYEFLIGRWIVEPDGGGASGC